MLVSNFFYQYATCEYNSWGVVAKTVNTKKLKASQICIVFIHFIPSCEAIFEIVRMMYMLMLQKMFLSIP